MAQQSMELLLVEFAMTLISQELKVKLFDGKTAKGRLYTIDPQHGSLILKNFTVYDDDNKQIQFVETQLLTNSDFMYIQAENIQNKQNIQQPIENKQNLEIDSEISKNKHKTQKELVKWQNEQSVDLNLDFSSKENWDQFQVNNEKFGIQFDYTDDKYTTKLDMTEVSQDLKNIAEKLETEVKNQNNTNRHQLEDRGQKQDEDDDEEATYSAVIGSGSYKNVLSQYKRMKKIRQKSLKMMNQKKNYQNLKQILILITQMQKLRKKLKNKRQLRQKKMMIIQILNFKSQMKNHNNNLKMLFQIIVKYQFQI